jgi:hypothetical protein
MAVDQSAFLLFLGTGFVIPFLVDLVTKKVAEPRVKSLALLVLSLVASGLTDFLVGTNAFDWTSFGIGFATTFLTAVGTLFGFAKPVGFSGKDGLIQNAFPGGLGSVAKQQLAVESKNADH